MMHIVWNEEDSETIWREGRDDYRPYLFEMMSYLGFTCQIWDPVSWMKEKPKGVTLVIGSTSNGEWAVACSSYCSEGNALLAIGDVYGLEDVLGIRTSGRMKEGWIRFGDSPLSEGLQSSFHCFDGVMVEPAAEDLLAYGKWKQRGGTEHANPAFIIRDIGLGSAALICYDLMKTFCLIQQGFSVLRDGVPAPDGTASIDEGILKTDDGTVLDWVVDRDCLPGGTDPFYLHPIVDEMRIFFARILRLLQEKAGVREGQVWFWPDSLTGIGHISHDSDGNSAEMAEIMLDMLAEAEIRSTWCVIMPGYPYRINERIRKGGHEIALHYNALDTEIPEGRWTEQDFRDQFDMLKSQFPGLPIVSNKNHYLRWEGDVAFYHWCERAGICVEQSRSGTKQGNKGFLFGTCHPNVPIGTPIEHNRLFDVLSLPTLAWDPQMPVRCTTEEAKALIDRSRDVYGVAHFLIHPGVVTRSFDNMTIGDSMVELCRYGREQGLEWWTSEQIWHWFRKRRQVRVESEGKEIRISTNEAIHGLTLMLPQLGNEKLKVTNENTKIVRNISLKERFGLPYMEMILDLPAGMTNLELVY